MRTRKLVWKQAIIESATLVQDASGEPVPTWAEFARRYAGFETLSGRELVAAQAIHSETTHRMDCRYLAGLLPAMRVRVGSTVYAITSINDVDHRHLQHLVDLKHGLVDG